MKNQRHGRKAAQPPQILRGTASTAALLGTVQTQFPGGAFAQGAGPEVKGPSSASSR